MNIGKFLLISSFLFSFVFLFSLAEAENLQNITIDIYPNSIFRLNQTNVALNITENITISFAVKSQNLSAFSNPAFSYYLTNGTANISLTAQNGSTPPGATLCNTFGTVGNNYWCKIQVNTSLLKPNTKYNLTFSETDIFNNTYSPVATIKLTPKLANQSYYNLSTGTHLIDDVSSTNTSILYRLSLDFAPSYKLTIATYNETPEYVGAYDPFNTTTFVEFIENWLGTPSASIFWAEIRMHYTDAQITALGLQESTLKLKSYNETTNSWQACPSSSVDTTNNYVYCNTTHFSTWTIVGDPVPTSSPAPASSSSSGGGGGGGSAAATTTPTAPAKETKAETAKVPTQTQVLPPEIKITAVTSTNIPLAEAKGKQELIQTISPQDLGLQKIDVEKINIVQTGNAETIFITSQDSLNAIAKISGLEQDAKQALDEIKNQITTDQVITLPVQASLQVFEVKSTESGKSAFVSKVSMSFTAKENLENVKILQVIPKSVAQNIAEVAFSGERPTVLQADPVVQWSFDSVKKGDTKDLSYLVKKKVDSLDATTVAVARQQQATETQQAPAHDYITVIAAVVVIVIVVSAFILIRRRK